MNSNSAKIYAFGLNFLLITNEGNYEIKSDGVYPSTMTANGLVEVPFDTTVQGALNNAIDVMSQKTSVDFAKGLRITFNEKIEDFDGPAESV